MNPHHPLSQQLVKTGYLDWLCGEMGTLAKQKFEAAAPEDCAALSRARVAYDLVAEVRQIVLASARDSEKL